MAEKFYKRLLAGAVIILALLLAGCGVKVRVSSPLTGGETGGNLKVHFIDVGQGDSTLIEQNGHFMLIDAGEKDQGETVVSYLEKQGVKKLDYVIGTHPHSDHIGGLSEVLKAFEVGRVIMPAKEHTIRIYENLLDEIARQNLKITLPKVGNTYELGASSFQIIAPVRDYGDNLNNWSVGIRLTYGETGFVFCGDAEKEAEGDIIGSGLDLKADVLKISHHGSSTSSSSRFMDMVDPDYGVISCGKNNDYGHPHKEIRSMLKKRSIKSFRTDELGTIIAVSDGKTVTFPGQETEDLTGKGAGLENQEYVINTNTRKFHYPDCSSATSMKKENRKTYTGTREDVIKMGYEPCQICSP
ncbi:MAG: MBL fold metallo-hydrolase [Lacrimispora sp.]|uniref:ComEC/Rec2 family competence protein n=1 Tax=Lacrimispora sp. TaxID=2719234 RepID=UPI0039E4D662